MIRADDDSADGDGGRLFSVDQLARLVGVPPASARAWTKRGWLRPVRTVDLRPLFDFAQLATARALAALQREGVTPARLRRALVQLGRWHPDAQSLRGALLSFLEEPELLVRTPDGRLAEPSGQLCLEFGREPAPLPPRRMASSHPPRDPLDAFEAALAHEQRGELEAALAAYEAALAGFGREPEILFNLGNVLFALGRQAAAAAHFLGAIELDPEFPEAWNNLGNALAELGRVEQGVSAYRKALEVRPDYADAHFNLAEALHGAGDGVGARAHWQAYLRRDPFSRWAQRARARLGEGS